MSDESVDVCIATLNRPRELRRLLDSLARQRVDGLRVRLVVVDNDAGGSAASVVESFRAQSGLEVVYGVERTRGISAARNRALAMVEADYFAFIDDDEVAFPEWLRSLHGTLRRLGADAAFGPSVPVLPADAPTWARRLPMFERQRLRTGTRVPHGATNNVMVRSRALGQPPARFDDSFGMTGGEDIDFFVRLGRRGATFVWCDEAEVHEPVPHSRLNESWVLRRSFRSGQTVYRIFVANRLWLKKGPWLLCKAIQATVGWLLGVALRMSGRDTSMKWLAAAYRAAGQLSGITGGSIVREYDAPTKG